MHRFGVAIALIPCYYIAMETTHATAALTVDRYGAVQQNLEPGDLSRNKRYGTFVVLETKPAVWRGEDRDIYSHVETWFTIRPATDAEIAIYDAVSEAFTARKALRDSLGATRSYSFDGENLVPSPDNTRMLDSYDDRWVPPTAIELTEDQRSIERNYVAAAARCHGLPITVEASK